MHKTLVALLVPLTMLVSAARRTLASKAVALGPIGGELRHPRRFDLELVHQRSWPQLARGSPWFATLARKITSRATGVAQLAIAKVRERLAPQSPSLACG